MLDNAPSREATIFRSKAVGEPPLLLATAVWTALKDAIAAAGDRRTAVRLDAPATPERVLAAIATLGIIDSHQRRETMDVRMDGRVAVITGASTGLGLAMAKEFAASGASVALLARKADALAAAKAEVAEGRRQDQRQGRGLFLRRLQGAADRRHLQEGRRPISARSTSWSTMPASATPSRSTR